MRRPQRGPKSNECESLFKWLRLSGASKAGQHTAGHGEHRVDWVTGNPRPMRCCRGDGIYSPVLERPPARLAPMPIMVKPLEFALQLLYYTSRTPLSA